MLEKSLSSDLVFEGHFLKVWRDQVELSDGTSSYREYIKHPGASIVLAVTEKGEILFVRQFRFPMNRIFIELPAGKKDNGEDPEATARRELIEETGYSATSCEHLADLHPCIGYSNEVIHLYLAQGLKHVGARPDQGEFLENIKLTLPEALEKIRKGEISDGKTIFGLMWYQQFVAKKLEYKLNFASIISMTLSLLASVLYVYFALNTMDFGLVESNALLREFSRTPDQQLTTIVALGLALKMSFATLLKLICLVAVVLKKYWARWGFLIVAVAEFVILTSYSFWSSIVIYGRQGIETEDSTITLQRFYPNLTVSLIIIFLAITSISAIYFLFRNSTQRSGDRTIVPPPADTQTKSVGPTATTRANGDLKSLNVKLSEIEKLHDLKLRGVLSSEDFERLKRRILGE